MCSESTLTPPPHYMCVSYMTVIFLFKIPNSNGINMVYHNNRKIQYSTVNYIACKAIKDFFTLAEKKLMLILSITTPKFLILFVNTLTIVKLPY